ncbi:chorismate synthase [Patescibacteria group bacterium]|nr:chorismate synthase [Patescibacteria group bacterium]MBU1683408.1 chorismate synthase [Patescibacteria group bacterium]MBU1934790.1 chorismate synthase [Patescibacteria group bacterium]
MSGNSFGKIFKITTWGESHGSAIGVVIDGCPAGLQITEKEIQKELDRRKPGQSKLTTERKEADKVEILSGVFEGKTTGTPISLIVRNKNQRSKDYEKIKNLYRPGHADFTYEAKYGLRDYRGGGRASARETIGRVAACSIAKKLIPKVKITAKLIEPSLKEIEAIKKQNDSIGGIIECTIKNAPAGLGSPVFDKLDARLAQAMLSIPGVKGFEVGSGFKSAHMMGSVNNDEFISKKGKIVTVTNNAGGILGGISNGMDIVFRVAFKPTSSITKKQNTVDSKGKNKTIEVKGRHDPCIALRAVPIVEAMAALVLVDEYLIQKVLSCKS